MHDGSDAPGNGLKAEELTAISHMMGTLPDHSVDSFLQGEQADPGSTTLESAKPLVVDCDIRDGVPVPLAAPEPESGPWQEMREQASHGDGRTSLGFVLSDHLALILDASSDRPARLVLASDAVIAAIVKGLSREAEPSASELRLLKQLLCGHNLRASARSDGVSHETKRTQYKTLAQKLGARSQNELTNKVLSHILLSLPLVPERKDGDEHFAELMREFVPQARTFRLRGESGTTHRFVDVGPLGGVPCIMFHSQILPDLRPVDIAHLETIGLRLIVPLRRGALSAWQPGCGIDEHLDHACESADLARSHFCGARAHVLACISGCAYAIEYARRRPEHVASFCFLGACVQPNTGAGTAGRLRKGILKLAMGNWSLYSRVIDFLLSRIRKPDTFRRMLLDSYRPHAADMAVVQAEYGEPHCGERLRKLFAASAESVKHDFYHQAKPRWKAFPKQRFPALFLHGTHDFIHPIAETRRLARGFGNVPVKAVQGGGQLLYHKHFEPMASAYRDFLYAVEAGHAQSYVRSPALPENTR